MKKFTSLFLVISMIICNLNTGVVEALSSCGNELKSLVNTLSKDEEKRVKVKEHKELDKETMQVQTNNNLDNTTVVDLKNKDKQEVKYLNKKSYGNDDMNIREQVILVYDTTSDKFYYYIDADSGYQEITWLNERITKNRINLNDLLKYNNLTKMDNIEQEVTFLITGTGNGIYFEFDNDDEKYTDIPFNFILYKLNAEDSNFFIRNVKSINVIGNNTITNSDNYEAGLTYSFNGEDKDPLRISKNGSFIIYNEQKEGMSNNIINDGYLNDTSEDIVGTSIVNISLGDDTSKIKSLSLCPSDSNDIPKKISIKPNYNSLSILLVSDDKSYILKDEESQTPYYYMNMGTDSVNDIGKISGPVKTKITLKKDINQNCYNISNKTGVEVIASKNLNSDYYLVKNLKQAMTQFVNLSDYTYEVIFLGDYSMTSDDFDVIKDYNQNTSGITFKTKVDDWIYLLTISENIELMVNNSNKFPIIFDDINFNYNSDDKFIYTNGRSVTFGYGVDMKGSKYPSISLGKMDLLTNLDSVDDNIYLNIQSGKYKSVIGYSGSTAQSLNIVINGGTFYDEVIAVKGRIQKDATLTINKGIFESRVFGTGIGSYIGENLDISINGGTFRDQVIGINGGEINSAKFIISDGNFNNMFIGVLSDAITKQFTLNGMFNKYLIRDNSKVTLSKNLDINIKNGTFNSDVYGVFSELSGKSSISLRIQGGNFKKNIIGTNISDIPLMIKVSGGKFSKNSNLIGNSGLVKGSVIISILENITIPIISEFDKLEVGSEGKGVTLTVVNSLDKGDSTGDLYLKNGSKVSFKKGADTSMLNNIVLNGANNTLILQPENRSKNTVLLQLSGELKTNTNNKLNVEIKPNKVITNGIYLIKFEDQSKADIENKYEISTGYYIRDIYDKGDLAGYLVLYPQTTFDLEYNVGENKLYMIDKDNNNKKIDAWWYAKGTENIENIILDTNQLYKYKGYSLFKENNEDRNLILTGNSSNKNITLTNNEDNLNVELYDINLTDSNITLNNLKYLKINGENTINSINKGETAFTYSFNSIGTGNRVLFGNSDNSYLKIFTKKDTNPFNATEGQRIDLKLRNPFNEEANKVRLKYDSKVYQFEIPNNTERLGLLLKDEGNYKLYYGDGDTGSSVYVAGNTKDKFTDTFATSSNNVDVYDYVRRANPVSTINVQMPSGVKFGMHVQTNTLDSVNRNNWEDYFYTTNMKFKNNSTVVQDQFTDEKGVHNFGKSTDVSADVDLEYMGVCPSNDRRNGIELVLNNKLDFSDIVTDSTSGVKLALNLDNIPIDESQKITDQPLGKWSILSNKEKIISIKPSFGNSNQFFNISKFVTDEFELDSSHIFKFRYGLKKLNEN